MGSFVDACAVVTGGLKKLVGIAGAAAGGATTGGVAWGGVGFTGGVKATGDVGFAGGVNVAGAGAVNDVGGVLLGVVVGGVKSGGGGAAATGGANKGGTGAEFGNGGNPVKPEDAEELNTFDWGDGLVGSAVGGFENIEVGCASAGFAKRGGAWFAESLEAAGNPWNTPGLEKIEEADSVGADAAPVAVLGGDEAATFCMSEGSGAKLTGLDHRPGVENAGGVRSTAGSQTSKAEVIGCPVPLVTGCEKVCGAAGCEGVLIFGADCGGFWTLCPNPVVVGLAGFFTARAS